MTPQQHDRLLMLMRNDNWPMADQIKVMNLVRQEFPATLRDELAMAALQSFTHKAGFEERARQAYDLADYMLQARKS